MADYPKDGVLIWGAGAMGGTIGATLAQKGCPVTLVDVDTAHVEAIKKNGLSIRGPIAQFTTPVDVRYPHELDRKWRVVFMAVKSRPTAMACETMMPHLDATGAVLSLQNGALWEVVANHVGRERTYATVGPVAGDIVEPGVINFGGGGGAMRIGQIDGRNQPIVDEMVAAANVFSPGSYASDHVQPYLWYKYCFNTITSANAIGKSSLADLIVRPDLRLIFTGLIREVIAVGKANGTYPEKSGAFDPDAFEPSAPPDAAQPLWDYVLAVSQPDKKPYSGMWMDLSKGRKTEVSALLSPISDMGDRWGVKTPLMRGLVALVAEIEDGKRVQSDDNYRDLAARGSDSGAVTAAA